MDAGERTPVKFVLKCRRIIRKLKVNVSDVRRDVEKLVALLKNLDLLGELELTHIDQQLSGNLAEIGLPSLKVLCFEADGALDWTFLRAFEKLERLHVTTKSYLPYEQIRDLLKLVQARLGIKFFFFNFKFKQTQFGFIRTHQKELCSLEDTFEQCNFKYKHYNTFSELDDLFGYLESFNEPEKCNCCVRLDAGS